MASGRTIHEPEKAGLNRAGGSLVVEASRGLATLTAVAFVGLVLGAGALGYWIAGRAEPAVSATASALPAQVAPTYAAKPGPWGDLICQRSIIEVPVEYLGLRSWENEPVQWFFRGSSPEALKQFLGSLELSSQEKDDLTNPSRWQVNAEGIFVSPSLETVLSLKTTARNQLYLELGRFEENVMQNQPFHWPVSEAKDLFASTRVRAASIAVFEKLSYVRGKYLLFSDWKALLSALPDANERNAVAQALMRRFAVFAQLRVTPGSDVEALVRYWGAGGHEKDIRPILEAAARLPQGANVSLGSLLPPPVRARVYTFPFSAPEERLNCHWTTFNFFNETPEPPAGTRYWRDKLKTDYVAVTDSPRYGDVLVLLKPDHSIVHSCIFVADDIVYTKNGGSPFAPWQLSTLADVMDFYSWDLASNTALKPLWYRKRS
ncbi:MAG TPA: hypothetical protein VFZ59_02795 [Verrucomicrobiae bacterium]|nr:hypothetical protein [Verrucomicrobiae bacterium]